jgi:hypothetical protein
MQGSSVARRSRRSVPERSARSPNDVHEFREKRWVELYMEKIEEMIGVLKSKGVPVLWVGLPVVRGPKSTADTAFLNTLYRDAAPLMSADERQLRADHGLVHLQRALDTVNTSGRAYLTRRADLDT